MKTNDEGNMDQVHYFEPTIEESAGIRAREAIRKALPWLLKVLRTDELDRLDRELDDAFSGLGKRGHACRKQNQL
ncbi:MAG: hypothetical protein RBT68_06880 [Spirochaetia bacterium]|jgi:hypothetical protein|nr:hypothetical protein [Spirochaetia bacterium]